MTSALVTQRPGLLVLLIFPTAWAAADASAEPRGILDRGVYWAATAIEVLGIAIIVMGPSSPPAHFYASCSEEAFSPRRTAGTARTSAERSSSGSNSSWPPTLSARLPLTQPSKTSLCSASSSSFGRF